MSKRKIAIIGVAVFLVVFVVLPVAILSISSNTTVSMYDELTETREQTTTLKTPYGGVYDPTGALKDIQKQQSSSEPAESEPMMGEICSKKNRDICYPFNYETAEFTDPESVEWKHFAVDYTGEGLLRHYDDYLGKVICISGTAGPSFGNYYTLYTKSVDRIDSVYVRIQKDNPVVLDGDKVELCGHVREKRSFVHDPVILPRQTTFLNSTNTPDTPDTQSESVNVIESLKTMSCSDLKDKSLEVYDKYIEATRQYNTNEIHRLSNIADEVSAEHDSRC